MTAAINVTIDAFNAVPSGGRDVYADLQTLYTDLMSGTTVQPGTIGIVDQSLKQLIGARSDSGLKLARLDTADAAHDLNDTTLNVQRSTIADANLPKTFSDLQVLRNSLEQATTVAKTTLDLLRVQRF